MAGLTDMPSFHPSEEFGRPRHGNPPQQLLAKDIAFRKMEEGVYVLLPAYQVPRRPLMSNAAWKVWKIFFRVSHSCPSLPFTSHSKSPVP